MAKIPITITNPKISIPKGRELYLVKPNLVKMKTKTKTKYKIQYFFDLRKAFLNSNNSFDKLKFYIIKNHQPVSEFHHIILLRYGIRTTIC